MHPPVNITPEDVDLWKRFVSLLDEFDADWFMMDRTKEQRASGQEAENNLALLAQGLETRGWNASRYFDAKTKVLRGSKVTLFEIRDLMENPANGKPQGWRIKDDKADSV